MVRINCQVTPLGFRQKKSKVSKTAMILTVSVTRWLKLVVFV